MYHYKLQLYFFIFKQNCFMVRYLSWKSVEGVLRRKVGKKSFLNSPVWHIYVSLKGRFTFYQFIIFRHVKSIFTMSVIFDAKINQFQNQHLMRDCSRNLLKKCRIFDIDYRYGNYNQSCILDGGGSYSTTLKRTLIVIISPH